MIRCGDEIRFTLQFLIRQAPKHRPGKQDRSPGARAGAAPAGNHCGTLPNIHAVHDCTRFLQVPMLLQAAMRGQSARAPAPDCMLMLVC